MKDSISPRARRATNVAFILEATFEYFVTIMTTDMFLSQLLTALNFTTAQQGLIASVAQFSCMAQLLAVLLIRRRTHVRLWATLVTTVAQLSFCFLYFLPGLPFMDANSKSALFILIFLVAYLLRQITTPFVNKWMMSGVSHHRVGIFTVMKENVSLVGGFLVTFVMGRLMDFYQERGDTAGFFTVGGIALFAFVLLQILTLVVAREGFSEEEIRLDVQHASKPFWRNTVHSLRVTLGNRDFRRIIPFMILHDAALVSYSFHGVYKTQTLGFSMTFNTLLILLGSVARILFGLAASRPLDRYGYPRLLPVGYGMLLVAFTLGMFIAPDNAVVTYAIFFIIYSAAQAIVNGGKFNLPLMAVLPIYQTDSVAWATAISGLAVFLLALAESSIVDVIEQAGNRLFGIPLYPQQFLSFLSVLFLAAEILYCLIALRDVKPHFIDPSDREPEEEEVVLQKC